MKRIAACAVLLVLPCLGQGPGSPIRLVPQRALRNKVAAIPLIANPADDVQRRVNVALQRINEGLRSTLRECDKDYAAFLKLAPGPPDEETSTEWERKIEVTMAGPGYLSLFISDFNFCGGAHTNYSESAVVFDLQTGRPVNWVALLPAKRAKLNTEETWNGIPPQQVVDPSLRTFYQSHLQDVDCRNLIDAYGDISLLIWLDAKAKRVMLGTNLPHVSEACAEHVEMTIDEARQAGFAEAMLQAVDGISSR